MSENYWAIGDEQILDESLRQYVEVMNGARQLGTGLRQQWIGAVATYAGIRRGYLEVKRENKAAEVAEAQEQARLQQTEEREQLRLRQAEERAQQNAERQAIGLCRQTGGRDWWENAQMHEIDNIDRFAGSIASQSDNLELQQAYADFAKKADPYRQNKLRGMVNRAKKADFWQEVTKDEKGKEELSRLFFYIEKYKNAGVYKPEDVEQVEEMAKLSLGIGTFKQEKLDEKFDEITQELREAIPEVADVDKETLKETMTEGERCLAEDEEYRWHSEKSIEDMKTTPFLSDGKKNEIASNMKAANEKFREWAKENPERARAWCKRNNVQEPEWLKDESAKKASESDKNTQDNETKEKGVEVSETKTKENESVSERQKDVEPTQNEKQDRPRPKSSPRDDVDPVMKKKAANDVEVAAVMGVVGAAGVGAASESLSTTQPGARKMGDSHKPLRVPTMADKTKSAGRSL